MTNDKRAATVAAVSDNDAGTQSSLRIVFPFAVKQISEFELAIRYSFGDGNALARIELHDCVKDRIDFATLEKIYADLYTAIIRAAIDVKV